MDNNRHLIHIDDKYIQKLFIILKKKPYINCYNDLKLFNRNSQKIIHNGKYFIETLQKFDIKYCLFKDDYIYLMSYDDVYKYSYGIFIKGLTV
jgi:hypothetical protein